ncbi:hypothetical protein BH09BAC3_BH09BAC3_10850 [soil metagenome]
MRNDLDEYYLSLPEPLKSSLLALRHIIVTHNSNITEAWKYRMPFFLYQKKMFCYFWIDKKTGEPYIGFMDGSKITHKLLVTGTRSRIKILPINTRKDLPIKAIKNILDLSIQVKGKF